MPTTIKLGDDTSITLDDDIISDAEHYAGVHGRSVPEQIQRWLRVAKIAERNPDLPHDFINGVLYGMKDVEEGKTTPYEFG